MTFLVLLTVTILGAGQDTKAKTTVRKVPAEAPKAAVKLDPGTYAIFVTSFGKITCKLFDKEAPKTVANFTGLAEGTKEWTDPKTGNKTKTPLYSGTVFHRTIPNFMIQGGDPLANGMGNPGYKFDNEYTPGIDFSVAGRLAMANSGRNTNGSQFFITDVPTGLPAQDYTIFGQVVDGLELVKKIGAAPCTRGTPCTSANDKPLNPVKLTKVTIQRVKGSGTPSK